MNLAMWSLLLATCAAFTVLVGAYDWQAELRKRGIDMDNVEGEGNFNGNFNSDGGNHGNGFGNDGRPGNFQGNFDGANANDRVRNNGVGNVGGINGWGNGGVDNGNDNQGGINGNQNGGSGNGNGNSGPGMNGNGNGQNNGFFARRPQPPARPVIPTVTTTHPRKRPSHTRPQPVLTTTQGVHIGHHSPEITRKPFVTSPKPIPTTSGLLLSLHNVVQTTLRPFRTTPVPFQTTPGQFQPTTQKALPSEPDVTVPWSSRYYNYNSLFANLGWPFNGQPFDWRARARRYGYDDGTDYYSNNRVFGSRPGVPRYQPNIQPGQYDWTVWLPRNLVNNEE